MKTVRFILNMNRSYRTGIKSNKSTSSCYRSWSVLNRTFGSESSVCFKKLLNLSLWTMLKISVILNLLRNWILFPLLIAQNSWIGKNNLIIKPPSVTQVRDPFILLSFFFQQQSIWTNCSFCYIIFPENVFTIFVFF